MATKTLNKELARIQGALKAPKGQYNKFGKYKYRSCEDILEGLKKVKGECVITLSDDIVMVGDRIYVKATATIGLSDSSLSVSAFARESLTKKGMDDSQISGTASSYARKYALNGLFMIDDTKDADTDAYATTAKAKPAPAPATKPQPTTRNTTAQQSPDSSNELTGAESQDYMTKMHTKAWDMFDELKEACNTEQRNYIQDLLNKNKYKEVVDCLSKLKGGK